MTHKRGHLCYERIGIVCEVAGGLLGSASLSKLVKGKTMAVRSILFAMVLVAPLWLNAPLSAAESKLFDVQVVRNIAYHDGPDFDDVRHRLDLYLPKGQKNFPVLFMVHGSSNSALSSFDLRVPGAGEYSTMNVFAGLGFDVWTLGAA